MSDTMINFVKKPLSLLPPTWPFKIYNALLKVPLLNRGMSLAIRRMAPAELQIEEGTIIFDKEDPVMSGAITFGNYEPETMSIFRSSLKDGMTVVDIGANLGYFSVIAAKRVGLSGKVLSYEPDPHNFALLKKNIAVNGFTNVKAIPVALSDRAGTRELFFGDNQCTLSFGDKKGTGRSETVVTETLDESLHTLGSSKVDMIKMDIEGAEPIALEGMKKTIEQNPELIMLFEFHPNAIERVGSSPLEFLKKIERLGFSISVIDEDRRTCTFIDDVTQFTKSLHGKELSRNLIATKKSHD